MLRKDYERLLTKVATLYYNEEKSQQEISDILQLSRSKVCRLLAEARNIGIVQIVVKPSVLFCNDLETKFERRFGLREAIIVNDTDENNLLMALGEAGANYLSRIITSNDIIGISWGQTLFHVVNQLQPFGVSGTRILQLVGSLNNSKQNVQASELARRLGKIFSSEIHFLHCPALVTSSQVKEGLLEDANIKKVFELGKKSTIAVLGIGSMSLDSELFKNNHLNSIWHSKLIEHGAVGDICMRFFDKNGISCCNELDDLVVGMNIDNIRKIRTVVCIAGGIQKAEAILGALRSRIPNVLIIDKSTANKVLELDYREVNTV